MCSGANLTPSTQFKQELDPYGVQLVFQGADPSSASADKKEFGVRRARACLDCGYVMLFLASERLDELRQGLASLQPHVPDDSGS